MVETQQQMAIDPTELRGLLDRHAITEQIYRYCRAVDRLDIPLGHSVFHEDATADYGETLYQGDGRGVIDFICASHLLTLNHSHQVSNTIVTLDGDHAGSETYFHSATRMMQEDNVIQVRVWGRYLDEWSRRNSQWRIDKRLTLFDFDEVREVTEMASRPAIRDRTDPSYAVLKGL
ncbi:3-phenylpropionate/cinnamic acid dioxygenase, small subunit [Mycobacterium rhizamassiliense]|uniref:3-phenylpropionate/cinnamic acid dioxygenase, small subunit n=2 Tax=Mycobacterium rhizamassiliense TaxID=1841860 RepID=A0A2U3NX21_9MYCO|nr:3-phenylpropionate/cinnamic acid dioxygenase, small subunit [Mycobacterium rhizamassiliense]